MKKIQKYLPLAIVLFFAFGAVSARALSLTDISGSDNQSGNNSQLSGLSMPGSDGLQSPNAQVTYASGSLINDNGTIYLIRGTQKIPFANSTAFLGLGYKFANVVNGETSAFTPVPGYILKSAAVAHPWGSWLSYKGVVYYSTSAGLVGVPSGDVLLSNGGDWNKVLLANKYDVAVLKANPNLSILTNSDQRVYGGAPTYSFSDSGQTSYNFFGNNTQPITIITVTAPAAGVTLASSTFYSISWTAPSSVSTVNISLVSAAPCTGSICPYTQQIASGVPNVGSFNWLVPSASISAYGYKVVVSDANNSVAAGNSGIFYIGSQAPAASSANSVGTITLTASTSTLANGLIWFATIGVAAPASSSVALISVPISVYSTTTGGAYVSNAVNNIIVTDAVTGLTVSTTNTAFGFLTGSGGATTLTWNETNLIPAGTSKTYNIFIPVSGNLGSAGASLLTMQLPGSSTYLVGGVPTPGINPTTQIVLHN